MSYILEAIKKAESERGNTRLHQNIHIDNSQHIVKPIPWIAIAIFINAGILLVWIGMQILSDSEVAVSDQGKEIIGKDIQQPKMIAVPQAPKIVVDAKQQTKEVLNYELELEQSYQQPINSKPSFINEPVNAVSDVEIAASPKNIESINKKIAPAKVEPLPVTEELLLEVDEDHLIKDESSISGELAMETQTKQVIPVLENPNVPSLNELPYELQQSIPDLVISVHIYNVVKSARKVRVNGKLLHQGDALGDDLIIQEITSYGVIFNYSGELFKMAIR